MSILCGARVHAQSGEAPAGTRPDDAGRTTAFESVGLAVEDIAQAGSVLHRAAR